jgi:hypothetical protein
MSPTSRPVKLVSEIDDARSSFGRFPLAGERRFLEGLREVLDKGWVHWVLAYLAGAWLTLQMVDVLKDIWEWPLQLQRAICVALGLGLAPALVVAWYHGERAAQRVTRTEVLLVGTLLFASAAVVWRMLVP